MQVTRVATSRELRELAGDWNLLAQGNPFRSWEWLATWWEHYGVEGELYVLTARDGKGRLRGILPLYRECSASHGGLLQWLGSGEVCTDYLSVLALEQDMAAVVASFANWLLTARERDRENFWDVMELDCVLASEAAVSRLVESLSEAGCWVHCRRGLNCWRLPLPESWDDLVGRYSKSQLRRVRRLTRKMSIEERGVLQTVSDAAQLPDALDLLVRLHQQRWQHAGQPGCFASPRFESFLRDVAHRLLAVGKLNLCWLELEGRPVAVEFAPLGEQTTYVYQGGVDPQALNESPGHMMTFSLVREAIRRGHRMYDLLRGDEPYKAEWGAVRHRTFSMRVSANHVSSRVRHSVWVTGFAMRNLVKGGLALTGMR